MVDRLNVVTSQVAFALYSLTFALFVCHARHDQAVPREPPFRKVVPKKLVHALPCSNSRLVAFQRHPVGWCNSSVNVVPWTG